MLLEEYQALFSDSRKPDRDGKSYIHLNNAGMTPLASPVREEIRRWTERLSTEAVHCWDDCVRGFEATREAVGTLIGAPTRELAFFSSTAHAVSQVAFSFGLKPGDEVLSWEQEYPSNLAPWREACARAGATLRLLPSGPGLSTPTEHLLESLS